MIRFNDKTKTSYYKSKIDGFSLSADNNQCYGYTIRLFTANNTIDLQYSNNSSKESSNYYADCKMLKEIFENEEVE